MSGGADSTALLLGLQRIAHELGLSLVAGHLHHGLRGPEADQDLKAVRTLCARIGVPLVTARIDAQARMRQRGLSGEAGLRTLRREFLVGAASRRNAAAIATGHTADDQLETVLFRLARGTGARGLAGMRPRNGVWIKPMLAATRLDVERDLTRAGIPWREDRSNGDLAFARNRIRHVVVPALAETITLGRPTRASRAGVARRVLAATREVDALTRAATQRTRSETAVPGRGRPPSAKAAPVRAASRARSPRAQAVASRRP